jgi:hypothetical protein
VKRLTAAQRRLLLAIAAGQTLKAHRDVDGGKEFRLHPADGRPAEAIARRTAEALYERGLIDSNKKFPAATFWLTEPGRRLAEAASAVEPGALAINRAGGRG